MRIRMVMVVAAIGLMAGACESDAEPQGCANPISADDVVMGDFFYGPTCIAAEQGAVIALDNEGQAPHTFTLTDTDVNVDVAAGEKGDADLAGVAPGSYQVTCIYHPQMTAVLEIGN